MSKRDEDVAEGVEGPAFGGIAPEMQACPKCRGEMVEGWIPRYRGESPFPSVTNWQPGAPVDKEVPGLFGRGHVKVPKQESAALPIRAFRCVRCGFLEFYAR